MHQTGAGQVELRAPILEITVKVPHDRIGIKVGSVMEFHAVPQMEDPGPLVVWRPLVSLRKSRALGAREIPTPVAVGISEAVMAMRSTSAPRAGRINSIALATAAAKRI
jgi:hypothetical protein